MKQVKAPVISNKEIMPGSHLMWLDAPEIAIEAKPGQFVMVGCGGNTALPRPLSIHRSDGSKIALLFREVGSGTHLLSQVQPRESLTVFGPCGNGFSVSQTSHNLLLIGGGIGVAPLIFMAQRAKSQLREVTLICGALSKNQIYPEHLLPFGTQIIGATDDGSLGYHGLVTNLIPEQAKKADQVFACGPMPMYKAMAKMSSLKNKPVHVSLELRMACGRGVCYGCTIKTKSGLKKVCEQGPVFDLEEILWDEL